MYRNKRINENITSKQSKLALEYIKNIIRGTKYENNVFLAGGAVRDQIMGKNAKDLDFVVRGSGINTGIEFAEWITKKMNNYKDGSNPVIFPKFGTAKFELRNQKIDGVDLNNVEIEVVSPRKEKYTSGSRKPEVSGGELKDDVFRRDLTVNSLLKNISNDEILDLTGTGVDDIKNGIVRSPSDPTSTFKDDPLRMLRAVRFTFKYNWKLPKEMISSMRENSGELKNISNERIKDELNKILKVTDVDRAIKLLKVTKLLDNIIPEFKSAYKMTQNKYHNKNVFGHTLDVVKKTKPELLNRLIALFHDIGKTVTRTVTPEGDVHFYGHESASEEIVEKRMRALKYPTDIINAVKKGVKNHMRLKQGGDDATGISDKALRKFKVELGDMLDATLDVIHSDNNAHSEHGNMPNQVKIIKTRLENLKDDIASDKPVLPVDGKILKDELKLKPGPLFSVILNYVLELWYENPNITKDETITKIKQNMDELTKNVRLK
jgi:poly(A) polymerase